VIAATIGARCAGMPDRALPTERPRQWSRTLMDGARPKGESPLGRANPKIGAPARAHRPITLSAYRELSVSGNSFPSSRTMPCSLAQNRRARQSSDRDAKGKRLVWQARAQDAPNARDVRPPIGLLFSVEKFGRNRDGGHRSGSHAHATSGVRHERWRAEATAGRIARRKT
jgi:hypothetical protein